MALKQQDLFVSFSKGIDSGRDPKTVIPSKFTKLDNLEWDKLQTSRQRPGYTRATITAHTGSVAVSNVQQLHVLGAEVLLEAISGFHALAQDRTISRDGANGIGSPLTVQRAHIGYVDVASSRRDQYNVDAATASPSGLECWVWTETAPAGDESRYQIVDGKTRAVLQEGSLGVGNYNPRVLVRDSAGASTFYIYNTTGGALNLEVRSVAVAAGAKAPGALSANTVIDTGLYSARTPFDAWYDSTADKVVIGYGKGLNLVLSILSGANGITVSATTNNAVGTALIAVSVCVSRNGATPYAFAAYTDGIGTAVLGYSTTLTGASPLATTLTSGATTSGYLYAGGRLTTIVDPFNAGRNLVFYDTFYTAGGYAAFFPVDIGFVSCLYDGSSPTLQSVFARGLSLAARPAPYTYGGATDLCITGILRSETQPTIFMLKYGGTTGSTSGFGTIAARTHAPPRVLARVLPGQCRGRIIGDTTIDSAARLASPMAVV